MMMAAAAIPLLAAGGAAAYSLFNNPYDEYSEGMDDLAAMLQAYYQPYMDYGMQAMGQVYDEYGNLISSPSSYFERFGGDIYGNEFTQSPGYQWQYDNAMNASNNAAAAGGMLGTQAHQQNAATTAQNLAAQDYYNYLKHQMGISQMGKSLYETGLGGMQGINQMGFNATNALAKELAAVQASQAKAAAYAQANQNQGVSGLIGGITGMF